MSANDLPLGDALAAAMDRARSEPPCEPPAEAEVEDLVRAAALAFGLSADEVVTDFQKGGALADLVRAVIGGAPKVKRSRGRPKDVHASWWTYVSVVHLVRQGYSLEEAFALHSKAAGLTESGVRARYERVRDRDKVSPANVPTSPIVAIFADPRPKTAAQK